MKGEYEELHALRRQKNKAKQSQFAPEAEPAQAIPISIQDNRDEAATRRKGIPRTAFSVRNPWGSGQRQDQEKEFEKTKPILSKGKSKKAKGKMRVNPEFLRRRGI